MLNQATVSTPTPSPSLVPLGGFGPRAAAITADYPVSTLILGLGQAGWHAASLLCSMLSTALQPKDQSRVQCFAIARRPSVIPEGRLPRENTLLLGLEEAEWMHVPGRHVGSGVANWWPNPPSDRTLIPEPVATSIRAYGRLHLFSNLTLVNETVQQRTASLVQESQRPGSDGRRLVILLASIAEAEGSGLFFDIAALLRAQLADSPTTIAAIVSADTTASDEAGRTMAQANVYATLKEIDAIMSTPAYYQIGLPNVGRSPTKQTTSAPTRPIDFFLITGDAMRTASANVPPAAPLSEMGLTWMLAFAGKAPTPLPAAAASAERFDGYTTFGVSKLGLPTGAAIDLIGSKLAQQLVSAMLSTGSQAAIDEWVEATLNLFRQDMALDTLFDEPKVHERLHELTRRCNPDVLTQEINKNKDKQDFGLRPIADGVIRRLDGEDKEIEMIDGGHTAHQLDTLRTRAAHALDTYERRLETQLAGLPTQLACLQGRGLQWTTKALEMLSQALNAALNAYRKEALSAEKAWQEARRRALSISYEHDERYSGVKRLLRGTNSRDINEIAQAFEYATICAAEKIRMTCSAAACERLWEAVDRMREEVRLTLQQLERAGQSITSYADSIRDAMDEAAQRTVVFPAGTLVDGDWFKKGVAQAVPRSDIPPEQLIPRVYRVWANGVVNSERRVDRFLRDLTAACRLFLLNGFQFAPLQTYILERTNTPIMHQAILDFQKHALPAWTPSRDTTGWTTHEWLRSGTGKRATNTIPVLPAVPNSPWRRLDLPSPDQDEMCLIRLTHGVSAESIEQLKPYRRAYDRLTADGIPLHIDRRWDATLPDLIKNTIQNEVSTLWESALHTSLHNLKGIGEPLRKLIRVLAIALGVDPNAVQIIKNGASDFALTVFPLPTFRLRLPPAQCPVVFSFSTRRPRELGQSIYHAVNALGLEPFTFIVNVNNRPDMGVVTETLFAESYNVVVLNEAIFKRVVGSRQPMSMLGEVVLSEIDLMLVSPFYTKAPVPEKMFYGREAEIKDVRRKIKTHSVTLIGGRRIGKTSTLQQIERMLRAPDSGEVPIYLDCHNAMNYAQFFTLMQYRWGVSTPSPDPINFEAVVAELKRRYPSQKIVFLFDEVDRLLITDQEQAHSELLFRTFRALSNQGMCQFIFSGERWLARAMSDSFSALFNFAMPVRLAPLEKPVVGKLISEPFEIMNVWLEDSAALINRIYEVSAGHPNIVQTICQEMVGTLDRGSTLLNLSHLEAALRNHELQEKIVETFWGQMSPLARIVTLIWPHEERHLSLEQILDKVRAVGLHDVTVREIQEAMKDLELYCFVTPKNRQYELIPVDFPALLDEMTLKSLEISAMIEKLEEEQDARKEERRKDAFR